MTAILLEGHAAARRMLDDAGPCVRAWSARSGRAPCLALLAVAAPSASAYLQRIEDYARIAGVVTRRIDVSYDVSTDDAMALISELNSDGGVDGILPLSPFSPGMAAARPAEALDPAKDVDGLTAANAGRLARGIDGLLPCTPQAALRLAEDQIGSVRGLRVTVVGASVSVGRPLVELLLQRGATVTVAHADTRDLVTACRTAEVLFVAAGKPGLIGASHVAAGATVIDIGINRVPDARGGGTIVGDVDLESVRPIVHAISAVPDGVGPLTTAFLIRNTLAAAGCVSLVR